MTGIQQFIIALVVAIPVIITAVGGFIVSIVTLIRQQTNHTEAITAQAMAVQTVTTAAKESLQATNALHTEINGRMTELLSATRTTALQEGATGERENPTQARADQGIRESDR